jgi:hypothetical protein
VPTRFSSRYFVAVAGLALLMASCSSTAPPNTTNVVKVKTSTNTGLCKLVSPSVVATAVSASIAFPTTVTHGSATECEYRAKEGTAEAVLIRYDTDANEASFAQSEATFANHGLKPVPVTDLGDKAYYFSVPTGNSTNATITTVVVLQGSMQLLTTGTGTVDQIGAIARYAITQYEASHSHH